jgi:hypothetical protein
MNAVTEWILTPHWGVFHIVVVLLGSGLAGWVMGARHGFRDGWQTWVNPHTGQRWFYRAVSGMPGPAALVDTEGKPGPIIVPEGMVLFSCSETSAAGTAPKIY